MIYCESTIEYSVKFYKDIKTGQSPTLEYIEGLRDKEGAKVFKYIEFLRINKGYLDEPYSRHIKGKIRELRVDFGRNRHRIFYFIFVKKTIILLHAFLKKTTKTPISELKKAEENCQNVLKNPKIYE
ncbi:MAG: addiction module toxin RelE [Candidatus Nealsonbacteria bacterium CG18_big_fil_WC_8_21_14_2_50_37_10]|uniref:Addiction module toxin RelE n=1 Tax=Candidatus Nealsonbacteria bacterium CG18_big_fil_WC_8_21_14_2_50_37_10 TaxID=1974717 RepID=A0A2H0FK75_9BACT|nr:type II toxin-antitoxin system RelE/ParE family toxin [Candidatus Parcubacteria bacterium]PIQ06300.1 MAG: addiction module toxin RelE [Candidatus Nealsonbacteria bacterium CG18_big_fil_WC_8_21_14_2_50_37_10]